MSNLVELPHVNPSDPHTGAPDSHDQPPGGTPEAGMALCMSGGGYRAMVFHIGALWRLNEAGMLGKLQRISSVSGGSITSAVLALAWPALEVEKGPSSKFENLVVRPLREMAGRTVDEGAVIGGLLLPGTISDKVAAAYRKYLFGSNTLQELPDKPRFVFNATNVQSGALFRFEKIYMWDYRVGKVNKPRLELAVVVGASSAFPPILSPVSIEMKDSDFEQKTGLDLQRPPFTTQLVLTDGGVYDNMGLETAWKRYDTILVSDAGAKIAAEEEPKHDWARHAYRVLDLVDNQVRSLRKRQLIDAYKSGVRKGGYWGIRTNIADYALADALPCPHDRTLDLAAVPTRLKRLDDTTQERLINWGYAVCDAALRKHVDPKIAKPNGFPYPRGV